ncbi:MAG: hypothetical protein HQK54_02395 [Oligoflexales bacterium]|nr:hypothetical protein [Oligoflexales bacterium]
MTSNKGHLKVRKTLKKVASGKSRKNYLRLHGSTQPNLPLDKPNANELAMKQRAGKQ